MSTKFLYESIRPRTQLRDMMMNADKVVDENEALKAENEVLKAKNKELEIQCQELNDSLESSEKLEQLLRRVGGKLKAQLADRTEELAAAVNTLAHFPKTYVPTDGEVEKSGSGKRKRESLPIATMIEI